MNYDKKRKELIEWIKSGYDVQKTPNELRGLTKNNRVACVEFAKYCFQITEEELK